jgi:hypothetical protein
MNEDADRAIRLATRAAEDIIMRVQDEFLGAPEQNAAITLVLGYMLGLLDTTMAADQLLNANNHSAGLAESGRALGRKHATLRKEPATPKGSL